MRYCAKSQLTNSPKKYLIIIIIELFFSNISLSPRRERVRVRRRKE